MNELSFSPKSHSSIINLGVLKEPNFLSRVCVQIIENSLNSIATNSCNDRDKCANNIRTIISNILSSDNIICTADNFINFYTLMSKCKISLKEYSYVQKSQNELVEYSLSVERKRFCSESFASDGGNRIFSQIAFFTFLRSEQGSKVINTLTSLMDTNEEQAFKKTIHNLVGRLAPTYIKLLSLLEAKTYLEKNKKITCNLEDRLISILKADFLKNKQILVPLGWEIPAPLLSHHMFLYIHKHYTDDSKATLHIIDTLVDCETPQEKILSDSPSSLISRVCSNAYEIHDVDDKIIDIATLLLLQHPDFTNSHLEDIRKPLTEESYFYLHKLNYGVAVNEKKIECDEPSPLSTWNWFKGNTCAFSTLQPLLQILAFKVKDIYQLTMTQQRNLKHYFELIMHSFKLSLIDKFNGPSEDLKKAVSYSISESANEIQYSNF